MINTKVILLLLVSFIACGLLFSQSGDEEYGLLTAYKLPSFAVAENQLVFTDSLTYYKNAPFTGLALSRYDNQSYKQVTQYKDGAKNGYQYTWYPDGKPLLFSNYRQGRLNGRFKGWYQFGGVIYDMYMKGSSFGGDQRYDDDSGRETESEVEAESGQDGRDQSND